MFTLVRPTDLRQGGLCHPVITWGNGHGTTPSLYARVLNQLASHGFVVIASNSSQVSMGDPPPMLVGVTWVLEQNANPASVLYQRIDTAHIGASGHSEGALSTMRAGADARIVTIAPIEGSMASRNLHGPALLMCGGMDTTIPCSSHVTSFDGITNQPVMLANQLAATHTNWVGGGGGGGALNRSWSRSPAGCASSSWAMSPSGRCSMARTARSARTQPPGRSCRRCWTEVASR